MTTSHALRDKISISSTILVASRVLRHDKYTVYVTSHVLRPEIIDAYLVARVAVVVELAFQFTKRPRATEFRSIEGAAARITKAVFLFSMF